MADAPFRCVLVGSESLLIRCGERLVERGHRILAVVSADREIRAWARGQDIRAVDPKGDLAQALSDEPFEYLFSIANLAILPDEVVALARRAALNFHDGPLPRYAGLYVTSWALLHREPRHGVVWHRIDGDVDAGDVLVRRELEIEPAETAFTLNARCYEAGLESFDELLDGLAAGRARSEVQDRSQRSYFARRRRPEAAGTLCLGRDAEALEALVRALDFGGYPNPLTRAKLALPNGQVLVVRAARAASKEGGAEPGTLTALGDDALGIATGRGRLDVLGLASLSGEKVPLARAAADAGLRVGDRLPVLGPEDARRLQERHEQLAHHEAFWVERLSALTPPQMPYARRAETRERPSLEVASFAPGSALTALGRAVDELAPGERLLAAFGAYLARLGGGTAFDLGFRDPALAAARAGLESYLADTVPVHFAPDAALGFAALASALRRELGELRRAATYPRDLVGRRPELARRPELCAARAFPVLFSLNEDPAAETPPPGVELALVCAPGGETAAWHYDPAVYDAEAIETMQRQLQALLGSLAEQPARSLGEHALLSESERQRLLVEWNDTRTEVPRDVCIHRLFEARAEQTPDATALSFRARSLSYRALNERANRLARHLRGLGVGPGVRVGLCLERSLELVEAVLAIQKAGGAYVPLDPAYPRERLAFMVDDAGVPLLLTQVSLAGRLPTEKRRVVRIDSDAAAWDGETGANLSGGASADDPAYVIYTSGSTGRPKGVPVAHHNAVNFFAGMDAVIGSDPPGVWLAVTSLSFDISVLELLWTLTRGFHVVVQEREILAPSAEVPGLAHADRGIDFSLFYFSSDESQGGEKYRMLLEGARFADANGFSAVWTPERHFHAFGGLYPNPAVTGAAVAAITRHVAIRAGSCVVPLHNPIRIAEEWAVVDNLSGGRVGMAIASGWQPNDFVLRPESYAEAKRVMFREIETVRRLWRGETVEFPGPKSDAVPVRTLPRPVQPELPLWVTVAGNPETFRQAGEAGMNVLTHLLGQGIDEVAEKLRVYREARKAAGHPGPGHVALMLHAFVGDDAEQVRAQVREPLKQYLKSAVDLVKKYVSSWPTFTQVSEQDDIAAADFLESLSADDMDALLEHSFERYYETSGLLGTPEQCLALVDRLKGIGVDEVACLIDFGVDPEAVLAHLEPLARLREACQARGGVGAAHDGDYSLPAQIARHGVSHFQCTPSMATLLLQDPDARAALRPLKSWLVGGEALPTALAGELVRCIGGRVINVYGPTETTIWSSSWEVQPDTPPAIGRPIANTEFYVVDDQLEPVPLGVPGELLIGGAGVVRGYLDRPELSAERFVPHPFRNDPERNDPERNDPEARVYRTGDLVRYLRDGNLEFLGRLDHQVKIRGHRIELGEIEARLEALPEVREAVVVAREEVPGDVRLVAYLVPAVAEAPGAEALRARLLESLPEVMVPAHYVSLDAFPLTPNAKIDRQALPPPQTSASREGLPPAPPANELEARIAEIWCEVLGRPAVGVDDNFFDLGGHSLLTVKVLALLREDTGRKLPMTDLFRFPTVRSLAEHLAGAGDDGRLEESRSRGAERREALERRRALRRPRRDG